MANESDEPATGAGGSAAPAWPRPKVTGWHSRFGGREWRHDAAGVYTRDVHHGMWPHRRLGKPDTARAAWALFGPIIGDAATRHGVPPQLVLMVLCLRAGGLMAHGFTGPASFAWDQGAIVRDVDPPIHGDYRAGPMQSRAGTVRRVVRDLGLPYAPQAVAPVVRSERPREMPKLPPGLLPPGVVLPPPLPVTPATPADHPLYDPVIAIDIGTAEIRAGLAHTGDDPILVVAALDSGGIFPSTATAWGIRAPGDRLDRAASWYGHACLAIKQADGA